MASLPKIHVLTEQTINQIAAGEVIENPASVVKELVENSMDAGATEICVEIQGGGRQLIRISDNGCGMSEDDALLCLERHATSKIKNVDDIENILTMGFRGEAIPSIASISKFSLLTTPQSGVSSIDKLMQGSLTIVEGGRIQSHGKATRSPGTTIEVKSLFFNVPVRRKFQRSPNYDTQEIVKILTNLSLAYPNIAFELISDQKSILKMPLISIDINHQQQLLKKIETLLGKEFSHSLCPLTFSSPPYEIEGYIGLPSIHKPNRTSQYLFINRRAVYSPLIGVAIREGYGTMLGTNRYPVFILHLRLPGSLFDVNVHPQKKEVRLRQEQKLKETLINAVQKALRQENPHQAFSEMANQVQNETCVYPWSAPSFQTPFQVKEESWEFKPNHKFSTPIDENPTFIKNIENLELKNETFNPSSFIQTRSLPAKEEPTFFISHQQKAPKVLQTLTGYCLLDACQVKETFSSNQELNGLLLLDQKQAYSRIKYEKLLFNLKGKQAIQQLIVPLTFQFSIPETTLLKAHLESLNQLGFSMREFGNQTFVLDAFPSIIPEQEIETYLLEMIQDLSTLQQSQQLQIKITEKLALTASRSSFSKNIQLSIDEGQGLVDQLFMCDMPYLSPSGSPIFAYFKLQELADLFRKYSYFPSQDSTF
ncbi:DNA mismatch repair endonuclease MutL [Candidatus Protochlamydia sp. R18]|uniref:DNA mismatch repair endonuclease MutL n=1 Tax=Candidatus Protochlamydia sp. R18 TaxID=1353977 RepID=UPI000693DD10|nr:DNA mismatch repair endonuclease MutL [Candidatus Protochlamydia sp. R18]